MRRRNVTGRRLAYLRSEKNMSQDTLAARLQCEGLDISRDVLANIESGRTEVPDDYLRFFQKALRVPIVLFFSKEVQDLDEKFARQVAEQKLKTSSRNVKS
ncbi:MAG: helix-turn-helix domain-containing protein [Limisphaerales bacterium]